MKPMDSEWLRFLHCLVWSIGRVDEWVLHRIVYELSRENIVEINNWVWFGDSPRSAEVDASIALLEMLGLLAGEDGVVKAVKEPVGECVLDNRVRNVVEKVLRGKVVRVTS